MPPLRTKLFIVVFVAQGMTGLASTDGGSTSITTSITAKTFLNASGITTPVANLNDAGTASMTINNALTTTPLFFVRSGYVNNNSTLYNSGHLAHYWSRGANSSTFAFNMNFSNSVVYSSGSNVRYYGMSVRCLYPSA